MNIVENSFTSWAKRMKQLRLDLAVVIIGGLLLQLAPYIEGENIGVLRTLHCCIGWLPYLLLLLLLDLLERTSKRLGNWWKRRVIQHSRIATD